MRHYNLFLFDLDGTLVDSVPDIAAAVDRTLTHFQLPTAGVDAVRLWVGNGSRHLVERALASSRWCGAPVLNEETISQVHDKFLHYYEQQLCQHSQLFSGVPETLQSLQKHHITMAVVTNKPQRFVQPLLAQLNIDHYFACYVGGDSLPQRKPHPLPLLHCCEQLRFSTAQTLMVGDSIHDVQAAQSAGIDVAAVNYGYNHGQAIELSHPTYLISSLSALLQFSEGNR